MVTGDTSANISKSSTCTSVDFRSTVNQHVGCRSVDCRSSNDQCIYRYIGRYIYGGTLKDSWLWSVCLFLQRGEGECGKEGDAMIGWGREFFYHTAICVVDVFKPQVWGFYSCEVIPRFSRATQMYWKMSVQRFLRTFWCLPLSKLLTVICWMFCVFPWLK